jgi:hypothetical protein
MLLNRMHTVHQQGASFNASESAREARRGKLEFERMTNLLVKYIKGKV